MKKNHPHYGERAKQAAFTISPISAPIYKLSLGGLVLVWAMLLAPMVKAQQSIQIRAQPVGITVPDASTESVTITNYVAFIQDSNVPVAISISGVPAGAGAFTDAATTNDSSFGANLTVDTTNLAQGNYTLWVTATDTNSVQEGLLPIRLQSGRMWEGAGTNVAANWSSGSSWVGGNAPGPTSDVIFGQYGVQTNPMFVVGVYTNDYPFTNCYVDVSAQIASLRFAHTNPAWAEGPYRYYHTIHINDGNTLSITGTNGLRQLQDYTTLAYPTYCYFAGGMGSLVVSNQQANIAIWCDNQQVGRLDLLRLGNFKAVVNRFSIADTDLYPYMTYLNITNGYGGGLPFLRTRRHLGQVMLARTNNILAGYIDPGNYEDPIVRHYALCLGDQTFAEQTAEVSALGLGAVNNILLDAICISKAGGLAYQRSGIYSGGMFFHPSFQADGPCTLFMRNTNGVDRVSVFAIGDNTGSQDEIGGTQGASGVADFRGGSVDIMVDRLYIGQERTNRVGGGSGGLYMAAGTFDVNTAILGYQRWGNGGTNAVSGCSGTLIVSTTAVFKVNNVLHLGYTTATNGNGSVEFGSGQVFVGPGPATLMVSNILVGGVTKESGGGTPNRITITDGGNVIVSNGIASADKMLGELSLNNGTLTLHVDGLKTTPYLYVTNTFTESGTSNALVIAQVNNFSTTNTHIPIFSYNPNAPTFGAVFSAIVIPDPYRGIPYDTRTVSHQWGLDIITNPPNYLVWKGNVSSTWNGTDNNWVLLGTSTATNFALGDVAIFDDSASTFAITVDSGGVTPGQVLMTNSTTYTFTGGGTVGVQGYPQWFKRGSGVLQWNAYGTMAMNVEGGTLQSTTTSGTMGAVYVTAGGRMSYGGKIDNGATIAGPAYFNGSQLNGTLAINTGGTFTNKGTINVAALSMQAGTVLVNSNSLTFAGSLTVPTNSYVHNAGFFGVPANGSESDTMTVENGATFQDDGQNYVQLNRLTIADGGTFVPGGTGIYFTVVRGNGVGTAAGRVTLLSGSTNIFKVDPSSSSQKSTYLYAASGYLDFGGSQSSPAFNGATILVTNINPGGYTNGQVFTMFGNTDGFPTDHSLVGTGAATNAYPIMQPDPPQAGLTWDLSNLRYLSGSVNGLIRIAGISTNPPTVGYSPTIYYGVILTNTTETSTNYTTNDYIVANVNWPTTNTGWRLDFQQNGVNVGLQNYDTNWTEIFEGRWTNQLTLTNTLGTNSGTLFYRMRLPSL